MKRVLHVIRSERGRALCRPGPGDRVVELRAVAPADLVTLVFEFDAVVVW
jgi:hypothetical protein